MDETKNKSLKELKSMAMKLEPIVRIGKSGITDSVIEEIKKHLKEKKLIKIKALKSCPNIEDKKKMAEMLAEKTNSRLITRVGFVVVLAKK